MQKLISELSRRNVVRVAGLYGVVGWVLAQVSTTLESSLSLPGWFDTVVVSLLLLGFPVALLLAWALELTPEGIRPTAGSAAIDPGEKSRRLLDYAILAALVVVAGLTAFMRQAPHHPGPAPASPAKMATLAPTDADKRADPASIAVLPFDDMSPAGDQGYFSDGIAEEILNVLAQSPGLKVASRTSAFQFRKSAVGIPAIAKALGVRHVLEGSVRRAGDTVRITAQLIDTQTDRHLWSETFDRPLTTATIFAIQDEIAKAIVARLNAAIGATQNPLTVATRKADTASVDAYDLYLNGRYLFLNRNKERLAEAARVLRLAISKDPKFARAWETLAAVYEISSPYHVDPKTDFRKLALEAATTALTIEPSLAMPHDVLGHQEANAILAGRKPDWDKALAEFAKALSIDPKDTTALLWRSSIYMQLGLFDLFNRDMDKCLEMDPANDLCRRTLAWSYLYSGRIDDALRQFEIGLARDYSNSDEIFAPALAARGDRIGALALLVRRYGAQPRQLLFRAITGATVSDKDRSDARKLVAEAKLQNDAQQSIWFILKDYDRIPVLVEDNAYWWQPLDPAYTKSAARKKAMQTWDLQSYWRKHGFPPQCHAVGSDDFACS